MQRAIILSRTLIQIIAEVIVCALPYPKTRGIIRRDCNLSYVNSENVFSKLLEAGVLAQVKYNPRIHVHRPQNKSLLHTSRKGVELDIIIKSGDLRAAERWLASHIENA